MKNIIDKKFEIDFIKYYKVSITISVILCVLSVILSFYPGINPGIDFMGGSDAEVYCDGPMEISTLREAFTSGTMVRSSGESNFLISMRSDTANAESVISNIFNDIKNNHNINCKIIQFDYVGPNIANDLIYRGLFAVIASIFGIFLYMSARFSMTLAFGGIIALIHDVIIVLGYFAVSGMEFTMSSVAALLTITGYSINDTVVVYDRIRDNNRANSSISDVINKSINSVLARSILTSFTTAISAITLIVVAGKGIADFSWAMLVGIIAGTYSSIVIAPAIMYYMSNAKRSLYIKTNKANNAN